LRGKEKKKEAQDPKKVLLDHKTTKGFGPQHECTMPEFMSKPFVLLKA
jgi:hypothetical protein